MKGVARPAWARASTGRKLLPWSGRRPSPLAHLIVRLAVAIHRDRDGIDAGGDDVLGILRKERAIGHGFDKEAIGFQHPEDLNNRRVQKGFAPSMSTYRSPWGASARTTLDDLEVELLLQLQGAIGKIGAGLPPLCTHFAPQVAGVDDPEIEFDRIERAGWRHVLAHQPRRLVLAP